jgi:hypothetical protein
MTGTRSWLVAVAVIVTVAAFSARSLDAQPPRLIKIGALTESWGPTPQIIGLRDGLQELAYTLADADGRSPVRAANAPRREDPRPTP